MPHASFNLCFSIVSDSNVQIQCSAPILLLGDYLLFAGISIVSPGLLMPPKKKARVDEEDDEKGNKLSDGVWVGILVFER